MTGDIVLDRVCKAYGDKPVLTDFSAVFPAGGVSCIMGRSGCGKTTLLRLILGLLTPDAGSIHGIGCRMSAVFQEDRLCEERTAYENLRPVLPRGTGKDAAAKILTELALPPDAHTVPVASLSGGMARRVAIARALLAPGAYLVLDEPFRGLDEQTRRIAAEVILRHAEGRGILMVTHEEEEAAWMGGTVLHMKDPSSE